MSADVFAAVEAARQRGRTVVMGTTVRTEGDPPSAPGNRALFAPDGEFLALYEPRDSQARAVAVFV